MTSAEFVSFSLSDLGIITFAFVEEFLELLNDETWFENGQSWSSQHVDTQKNISFINQSTLVEPLVSMVSIDPNENQCGVEETQNCQLEADGNGDLSLSLPKLEF